MKNIIVVGATNIDIVARSYQKIALYDKNPGAVTFSYGGVARNICENLARLEVNPTFVTIVGDDEFGNGAISYLQNLNVNVLSAKSNLATSTFISILDHNRDNYISISGMDIVDEFTPKYLDKIDFSTYDLIVSDANSEIVAKYLANMPSKLFIDATSDAKVNNIKAIVDKIDYLKCTESELQKLFSTKDIAKIIAKHPNLTLIVTNKDQCVYYTVGNKVLKYLVTKQPVVNAIGAGDSFSAGFIYGLSKNYAIEKCVEIAVTVAAHTISVASTVSEKLCLKTIGE